MSRLPLLSLALMASAPAGATEAGVYAQSVVVAHCEVERGAASGALAVPWPKVMASAQRAPGFEVLPSQTSFGPRGQVVQVELPTRPNPTGEGSLRLEWVSPVAPGKRGMRQVSAQVRIQWRFPEASQPGTYETLEMWSSLRFPEGASGYLRAVPPDGRGPCPGGFSLFLQTTWASSAAEASAHFAQQDARTDELLGRLYELSEGEAQRAAWSVMTSL